MDNELTWSIDYRQSLKRYFCEYVKENKFKDASLCLTWLTWVECDFYHRGLLNIEELTV